VLLSILPSQAHTRVEQSQIDTFYSRLYHYKFLSADSSLKEIELREIDKGIVDLLKITYQWWLIISGESNSKEIESLIDNIDNAILTAGELNSHKKLSQEKLFQLIVMYSYKSRLHNLLHNRLNSFSAYHSSLDYFKQLVPCEKVSCDMYNFVAGMYYSLGGYMKKEHPSLYKLGFDSEFADQQKGYSLLSLGVKSQNLQVQTESIYFYMKLCFDVEKNPATALTYSQMLVEKYPENLVFRYNQILILNANHNNERMEKEYFELKKRAASNIQLNERQRKHFAREYSRLEQ
jgi:hypothetical protein